MKNLQLTKFNLRFGNKKEAELFMQKYKELQLPVSILGQSFFIEDKEFIFIGLTENKSNSLIVLNQILHTNYKNNINNYNAILMSAKELAIPNNYYFRSKHIYKSEYLLTLNLKEFVNSFSSTF
jgi:hypothetical protein